MPFRFHLKRQRRYEVSSRKSYVVCVRLLDNRLIECTLTAESTGYECLENLAQRVELNEVDFFGLRYVNKKLRMRWLDLEKPIKKQMDRHSHSPLLYFGVMFYINEVEHLKDAMTRYQYFLQLKSEVIEGKLPCTQEQAVSLAAYSIQAEFGDHDKKQHTPEFFKDYVILPRTMTSDEASLGELTQEVVSLHLTLTGLSPAAAELKYLNQARQLDGYGTEFYPTKDDKGRDYLLGVSYMGISVKDLNGRPSIYFRWSDIANLTQNKRTFGINGMGSNRPIEFHLDDGEIAKYVFKMCSLQHQFYKATHSPSPAIIKRPDPIPEGSHSTGVIPDIQQSVQKVPEPPVQQIMTPVPIPEEVSDPPQTTLMADSMYEESQTYNLNQLAPEYPNGRPVFIENLSQSQTNLPQSSLANQNVNLSASTGAIHGAPAYRPAPDYEAVMQQRLQQRMQTANNADPVLMTNMANLSNAQVYSDPQGVAYSQPEMRHSPPSYIHHMKQLRGRLSSVEHQQPPSRPVDRASSLIIHPTYSSPDLAVPQGFTQSQFSISESTIQPQVQYKPPPPYIPPRGSSSFPDLASQTHSTIACNSPDLVPPQGRPVSMLLPSSSLAAQSRFDQSVENLALDTQVLSLSQQNAYQSKHHMDDTSSTHSETPFMIHNGSIPDVASTALHSSQPQLYNNSTQPQPAAAAQHILQQLQLEKQQLARKQELLEKQQQELLFQQTLSTTTSMVTDDTMIVHSPSSEDPPQSPEFMKEENMDTLNISPDAQNPPKYISPSHFIGLDDPLYNDATDSFAELGLKQRDQVTPQVTYMDSDASSPDQVLPGYHGNHMVARGNSLTSGSTSTDVAVSDYDEEEERRYSMGPLKMATLNGLTMTAESLLEHSELTDDSLSSEPDVRAPKDERRKDLEARLEAGQVFIEFEQVPKKRLRYEVAIASTSNNIDRNRFKDVLPYDDNRVKLTPSKENPQGYINASHIRLKITGENWWYIAAQGPMDNTAHHFWQMVWEQEVQVIAMLTKLMEHGKPKCFRYWPEAKGPKHALKFGDYQVSLKFTNISGSYSTSVLCLYHKRSKKERLVWHLQYTDWPDHGCPEDPAGFLDFLNEIEAVKRQRLMEKRVLTTIPVLIHCTAGVGRSGVTILTEIMKACFEYNETTDVPAMLLHLREQRMYLVQTVSQYSFIYQTLVEYLKGSRLI